jgi:hypothetical protein
MLNVLRHLDLPEQERVEDGEKMVEIGLFYEVTACANREHNRM